jgi:hypothetical protein
LVRDLKNGSKFRTNRRILMTNRLVQNMYIIDSASTTCPIPYGYNGQPIEWNLATTANVGKMKVTSVIFMASTTAARCQIAIGDTTNVVLDYALVTAGTGTIGVQRTQVDSFGYGVPWMGVFPVVVTACTMCLVLE